MKININGDEIVFATSEEAEMMIRHLKAMLKTQRIVTLAEMYLLMDLTPTRNDYNWGWSNLDEVIVIPIPLGYTLDVPTPKAIH